MEPAILARFSTQRISEKQRNFSNYSTPIPRTTRASSKIPGERRVHHHTRQRLLVWTTGGANSRRLPHQRSSPPTDPNQKTSVEMATVAKVWHLAGGAVDRGHPALPFPQSRPGARRRRKTKRASQTVPRPIHTRHVVPSGSLRRQRSAEPVGR